MWGFVGPPPEETKDDDNIYVYTHKTFDVDYNDNRVRRRPTPWGGASLDALGGPPGRA